MNRSRLSVTPCNRLLVLLVGLLLLSSATHASLITYQISGLVTSVSETAAVTGTVTSINVGDSWSLFATIDTGTADAANANPLAGIYSFSSMAGTLTVGPSVSLAIPETGQSAQVEIRDNDPDRIEFNAFGVTGITIDGLDLGRWDLVLRQTVGSLFSTDFLTESVGRSLTDFDDLSFNLSLNHPTLEREGAAIIGSVTSYSAVVPVPAAVWLFGSGLLGLIGISRRKKA